MKIAIACVVVIMKKRKCFLVFLACVVVCYYYSTSSFAKKYLVDFEDVLKIGDVRYSNMTQITIKVQLF